MKKTKLKQPKKSKDIKTISIKKKNVKNTDKGQIMQNFEIHIQYNNIINKKKI